MSLVIFAEKVFCIKIYWYSEEGPAVLDTIFYLCKQRPAETIPPMSQRFGFHSWQTMIVLCSKPYHDHWANFSEFSMSTNELCVNTDKIFQRSVHGEQISPSAYISFTDNLSSNMWKHIECDLMHVKVSQSNLQVIPCQ